MQRLDDKLHRPLADVTNLGEPFGAPLGFEATMSTGDGALMIKQMLEMQKAQPAALTMIAQSMVRRDDVAQLVSDVIDQKGLITKVEAATMMVET